MSKSKPTTIGRPAVKRPRGRPSLYTPAVGAMICERIGKGETLEDICREPGAPGVTTVHDWRAKYPAFSEAFAQARARGFDAIAAEALRIANTPHEGVEYITRGDGSEETRRGDMLGHRKLQIETRLKLLAKWDPKRYGEKLALDVADVTDRAEQMRQRRALRLGKT